MTGDNVRFTLSNDTKVTVKKVLNNKYDFELTLPNGNRKTFIWFRKGSDLNNLTGVKDKLVAESVTKFASLIND